MPIAADYPFLDVLWSMIIFFTWVIWIWMMIIILTDVFRRRDIGGWAKALWVIFLIILPFLGVLVYLIANHNGMAERSQKEAPGSAGAVRRLRPPEGLRAAVRRPEIEKAKGLLDSGAITPAGFDAIKAKALAAPEVAAQESQIGPKAGMPRRSSRGRDAGSSALLLTTKTASASKSR